MTAPVDTRAADNRPLLVALADGFRDFMSGNPGGTPDPSPGGAELVSINPTTAVHGTGPDLTLHAIGTAFVKGVHEINFNGIQSTTFVSATELTATVKPSLVAAAGTVPVTVTAAEGSADFIFT